ncbi:MAG TPA: ribose 5-phosphate isomerase B [Fimbriimonas sp.]|nr:ribose 5-phosphate isomerase B [Fimbriimonas sp.]
MRIALGGDHAGFELKELVRRELESAGHVVIDKGAYQYVATDDYPDFALAVARSVGTKEAERGIVVCGSGIGASIAANKVPGVRAGLCTDSYSAHQGVEHDDMNVLILAGRITGVAIAEEILKSFVGAKFSGEERHLRRLEKVLNAEKEYCGAK